MPSTEAPRGMLRPIQGAGDAAPGELAPANHFVILGHPRSGSTLLVGALLEHPAIRVYGELFQDDPETRRQAYGAPEVMYETGMDGASFLANSVFREDGNRETLAVGFKLFYAQAREPGALSTWAYLRGRTALRIIHLTRDNALHSFVSLCEAEASGQWHLELDETPSSHAPIRIDPAKCLEFLDSLYAYREWVRQAFGTHELFELSYERHLLADFCTALRDVQTFLGVPTLPVLAVLGRQGARPIEERIRNYGEIRDALRRTIHAC